METPLEVLRRISKEEPNLILIKVADQTISYGDAWQRIRQFANLIVKQLHHQSHSDHHDNQSIPSLNRGKLCVVGLHVTAEVDFILGVYAIWMIGATPCVFNKDWSIETRQTLVERLGIKVMLFSQLGKPVDDMSGVLLLDLKMADDVSPCDVWTPNNTAMGGRQLSLNNFANL